MKNNSGSVSHNVLHVEYAKKIIKLQISAYRSVVNIIAVAVVCWGRVDDKSLMFHLLFHSSIVQREMEPD